MQNAWKPSRWGEFFTKSIGWRLSLRGVELFLESNGESCATCVALKNSYCLKRGWFWASITLFPRDDSPSVTVDGLPNHFVDDIEVEVIRTMHQIICEWLAEKQRREQLVINERRWFTHEMQSEIEALRPSIDINAVRESLKKNAVRARLGKEADAIENTFAQWERNYRDFWASLNAAHTERELQSCKVFFDRVEGKPLTEEQVRAVICFDNRVQVVAAAGSGKTSTMVAKAAYAVYRDLVSAERIVMLAFNKKAAEELESRAQKAFTRVGLGGVSVEAATFHSLGLRIIGQVTKKKPKVPEWAIDPARSVRKLDELVERLKVRCAAFRKNWDLYRCVVSRDMPKVWDNRGRERVLTLDGKSVRSQEEAIICNWLFYHGVEYLYEEPYKFSTATATHRQYCPDFFYPSIDLYHEHLALDANGNPPSHFKNYLSGVDWKRNLHREKGTRLIETTSYQIQVGEAFEHLENELSTSGISLEFDPNRRLPNKDQAPIQAVELLLLVRAFISHYKSNCLTKAVLSQRLEGIPSESFRYRYSMFIDLFLPILDAWDDALSAEGGVDFEDMINLAAKYLEEGRCKSRYDLVMVDEFQDASRARARLCRALVQQPNRHLFAVGDDWQSINRFAGADVSVMTGFREWFGSGLILKLEQTFRCPQALCDVSSQFVSKNPAQISKRVKSFTSAVGPVLHAFQVNYTGGLKGAIEKFIETLAEGVKDGSIPVGLSGKISVYILGRYNYHKDYLPGELGALTDWLEVSFDTIHRSKGREADYVILPEMVSTRRAGFPDTRGDIPVLDLVMPTGDSYLYGEERRLFYVALTRARRSVVMFTVRGRCSSFLRELVEDNAVVIQGTDGEAIYEEPCPACDSGVLILRQGHNAFYGCSNYPNCCYTKPTKNSVGSSAFVVRKWLPRPVTS